MTNIWGFLSQTLFLSSITAIILFIKFLMRDKLPARWQYGVWNIAIVCVFVPAGRYGGYIFPRLHILADMLKTFVESRLNSVFTDFDKVQFNTHILPVITGKPVSITDFLFIAYITGIAVIMFRYLFDYFRLKTAVSASAEPSGEMQNLVDKVAEKYSLPACKVRTVPQLSSAFVFGVVKPLMVLPQDKAVDEKVILHELLHLKYKDLWKNLFWAVIKAFHWINPFMLYVCKSISNDMESLCDYRVMELLEGEQRREYGRILLSMTNEKYPSSFGTTSISNGRQFISQRIQAIARFKLYPKGMEMVSVCIVIMLLPLVIYGSSINNFSERFYKQGSFLYQYQQSRAKLTSCRTVAGAIDTYAKAILTQKEPYYLAVKPDSVTLQQYYLPPVIDVSGGNQLYYVVDLQQTDNNTYIANLLFIDYKTNLESPDSEYYKDGESKITVPIKIIRENGWKVYQTDDAVSNLAVGLVGEAYYTSVAVDGHTTGNNYIYSTAQGDVDIAVHKVLLTDNSYSSQNFMFQTVELNYNPMPHTDFTDGYYAVDVEFIPYTQQPDGYVNIHAKTMKTLKADSPVSSDNNSGAGSGRGPDRRHCYANINMQKVNQEIDQIVYTYGDKFTTLQKSATERRRNRATLIFARLNTTKDNFVSLKKTKGIHIFVNYNGSRIRDLKVNTKTGELLEYNN
ncbi:MAG: hypothetical protein IKY90_05710 [Oscillospiraceae bacterium]|nr:hypothetical protein [Oscillospiraceae bacterium]